MDIYGNTISLEPVIYLIKEVDEDVSNKKISQQEENKLLYALKAKIDTAINSIIIVGTETLLNTVSIASQDKRESIYSKLSG